MPLNRMFQKSSLPVLLGLAAIAVIVLFSSAGHSRAKPSVAAQPALPQVQVAEVIHRPRTDRSHLLTDLTYSRNAPILCPVRYRSVTLRDTLMTGQ